MPYGSLAVLPTAIVMAPVIDYRTWKYGRGGEIQADYLAHTHGLLGGEGVGFMGHLLPLHMYFGRANWVCDCSRVQAGNVHQCILLLLAKTKRSFDRRERVQAIYLRLHVLLNKYSWIRRRKTSGRCVFT